MSTTHEFAGVGSAARPTTATLSSNHADRAALALRIGLGAVFVTGGWWKFSRAIDAALSDALVTRYMASDGYINAFFANYLFEGALGGILTPLGFLTLLSGFELISGLALMAGLFVRPLSLIWAFLLWSFVVALPVTTTPGAAPGASTYLSPSIIVQIRDIGLSGMFFVLLHLGSGAYSLDRRLFVRGHAPQSVNWNAYGLLLRLSVAAVLLVGGFFAGLDHVKSWIDAPLALALLGIVLASGHLSRIAGAITLAILLWYIGTKLSFDNGFWNNLNAIKREIAFTAAAAVLTAYSGGAGFNAAALIRKPADALFGARIAGNS